MKNFSNAVTSVGHMAAYQTSFKILDPGTIARAFNVLKNDNNKIAVMIYQTDSEPLLPTSTKENIRYFYRGELFERDVAPLKVKTTLSKELIKNNPQHKWWVIYVNPQGLELLLPIKDGQRIYSIANQKGEIDKNAINNCISNYEKL